MAGSCQTNVSLSQGRYSGVRVGWGQSHPDLVVWLPVQEWFPVSSSSSSTPFQSGVNENGKAQRQGRAMENVIIFQFFWEGVAKHPSRTRAGWLPSGTSPPPLPMFATKSRVSHPAFLLRITHFITLRGHHLILSV